MVRTFSGGDLAATPSDLRTAELPETDHGYELADDIDRRNGWADVTSSPQTGGADALGLFFRWLVDQPRLRPQATALRALAAIHALRPDLLDGRSQAAVAKMMNVEERTFRRAARSFRQLMVKR